MAQQPQLDYSPVASGYDQGMWGSNSAAGNYKTPDYLKQGAGRTMPGAISNMVKALWEGYDKSQSQKDKPGQAAAGNDVPGAPMNILPPAAMGGGLMGMASAAGIPTGGLMDMFTGGAGGAPSWLSGGMMAPYLGASGADWPATPSQPAPQDTSAPSSGGITPTTSWWWNSVDPNADKAATALFSRAPTLG